MSGPAVSFTFDAQSIARAFNAPASRLGKASSLAMRELAQNILAGGRASIASAGFSKRWQDGLIATVYPTSGTPIDEQLYVRHRNNLARVFEFGAPDIVGRPLMWLPLDAAPTRSGSTSKMTPRQYTQAGGALRYIPARVMGHPMLAKKAASRLFPTEALYIGIQRISIPKKWDIMGVCERESAKLPELLAKHLMND